MSTYLSIPADKIDVVPLGINLDGFAKRIASPDRPFTVGYLARIAPEKGLHALCDAYVRFRQRPGVERAQLEVAGYMASDQQGYLREAGRRLEAAGLGSEFHYRGLLDREQKIRFLRNLDVFSVPTVYVEPKGLFLLEAMACGVPVIQPNHGAFPEMIAKTSGGVLVEADNGDRLARRDLQPLERSGPSRRARREWIRRRAAALQHRPLRRANARGLREVDVLTVSGVGKTYPAPQGQVEVLTDISLSFSSGDAAAVMGPSGQREEHAAVHSGRARAADNGYGAPRGAESIRSRAEGARGVPQQRDRVRFSGSLPAPAVHRARERARSNAGWSCRSRCGSARAVARSIRSA